MRVGVFYRLFKAEQKKLSRSACIHLAWVLPLLFALAAFFVFDYRMLGVKDFTEKQIGLADGVQVNLTSALWGAFFFPILIALLPALIFRVEHRVKAWRYLGAMPVSGSQIYLAKALWAAILSLASLVAVWFLLLLSRVLVANAMPQDLVLKFYGLDLALILGWLWLGALPVMTFYLWASNRINSLAVPVMLGMVGILLTTALTSQYVEEPWKRDFIPWITPHICAAQALGAAEASKKQSLAGDLFKEKPDILRLPDGREKRTWQNIPEDVLNPPPIPTPKSALAAYSLVLGTVFLLGGALDAGRLRR